MIDKTKETSMAIITAAGISLFIAIITLLTSCYAKQRLVTETINIHDTIRTQHYDTIRDVKYITHTDTLKQVEFHNVTLSQQGDTIKETHHYYESVKTIIIDSTKRYKATVDSLNKALRQEKARQKQTYHRSHGWWPWMIIVVICAALFYAARKISRIEV